MLLYMAKFKKAYYLILVFPLSFCTYEYKTSEKIQLLDQKWVHTQGKVTSQIYSTNNKYNSIAYAFYINDTLYKGASSIKSWDICRNCQKLCIGDSCKIIYIQNDPTINELFVQEINLQDTLLVEYDDCFRY